MDRDRVPLLDLRPQYEPLRREIDAAVRRVIDAQAFVLGPEVEGLENEVAAFTGAKHAVGCASGTDALILSLAALGVGPGDEVLTTPFSFFSTASCASKVGARVRFCDIKPDTFQIDPERIESALTPRTRAIVPVHLFGQCASMVSILEIASRRNVAVVEDAAQALGARCLASSPAGRDGDGRSAAGTLGDTGCYSFFPTKNLGGFGDGGMIVTGDGALAERLRLLRVHGGEQMYHHRYVGWNSRLDALQAAVLRVKLPHLDAWSELRGENAARYDRGLADAGLVAAEAVRPPARAAHSTHIFNQYTVRVADRERLMAHLRERGIGHAVYYPVPLHRQECFHELGYGEGDFPEAERACREVLSLPVYPGLASAQQRRVVDEIAGFYRS